MSRFDRTDLEYMTDVEAALRRRGHPLASLLSWTVVLLVVLFLVWADYAIIDEVTRGNGRVIPSRRVQEIQNLEGGILEEVLVAEGQVVQRGDVLLRIDNEAAQSFFRDAYAKALEHRAAIARLAAEAEGKDTIPFPEEIRENAPIVIQDQLAIHAAHKQKLNVALRILDAQLSQRKQEIREMRNRKRQLTHQLSLAVEQRDIARPLMERKVYPKVDFIHLEQNVLKLKTEVESLALQIPRTLKGVEEAEERIAQQKIQARQEALEEIGKRRVELKSLTETIAAGQDRVTRTDVRSPVRGTIKRININTIGGVIKPGESILEIVPLDDTLLIEAMIRPADIAFLHPGQASTIKLSAYDYSIYGGLSGKVEQISADTIEEKNGETFYVVKLRTDTNTLLHNGKSLPIIPGMTASVDILTGKKSILDYLLKPILKAQENALRER